jgi:hypothetical protein
MGTMEDAAATQLANIQTKTGKTLQELAELVNERGDAKHGAVVAFLKAELGLGHGDANTLVHVVRRAPSASTSPAVAENPADAWYAGPKAPLRALHESLLASVAAFATDMEASPKKTYVSLRRAKQFATIGPGPRGQIEIGLNLRAGAPASGERLVTLPAGGMCTHRIRIATEADVDEELLLLLRAAYDSSG